MSDCIFCDIVAGEAPSMEMKKRYMVAGVLTILLLIPGCTYIEGGTAETGMLNLYH